MKSVCIQGRGGCAVREDEKLRRREDEFVTVTNPNRDTFTHYDSSLQLDYFGDPVGFVFIPAGRIYAGRSQRISAKFEIERFLVPEKRRVAATVRMELRRRHLRWEM
ncbi:hypothetical protein AgCh_013928 [Apium graveolens]